MLQINPGLIGKLLTNQMLLGDVDGVNTVFTTTRKFLHGGDFDELVYLRGQRRLNGGCDYVASESGGVGTGYDTITFLRAPKTDDNLVVDYFPASA